MSKNRILLSISGLEKSFGERKLFRIERLDVFAGDRIGLVGANGSGKTTLLMLLCGEMEPDAGKIERFGDLSCLRQFGAADEAFAPGQWSTRGGYSGGEKMRRKLANALEQAVPLLLLDEPTANLDVNGVALLVRQLQTIETFILVSHDRAVLDQVCNQIWELHDAALTQYDGSFTAYRRFREEQIKRKQTEYERYCEERHRLERIYADKKRRASAVAKPGGNMTPREAHLNDFLSMHKSTDTKQRGMERAANAVKMRLERLEVKEKPREDPRASFNFSLTNPPEGKTALRAEALCYGYPGLKRKLLEKVSFELPTGRHTLLCGANGCGKTTLLNLLARAAEGGLPPDVRGTVYTAPKMRLGYFYQGLENLDLNKTALENVMEDSVQSEGAVRGILAKLLLRGADFEKKAGVLSGGERIRLQFAKLFASPANVLFLDEPTNFLDLPSIEALQEVLTEYEGTVLFVSHDQAFANAVAQRMMRLENGSLTVFEGNPSQFEEWSRRRRTAPSAQREVLELRLNQVVGKLSARKVENKEELEQQYQQLLAELRQCQ